MSRRNRKGASDSDDDYEPEIDDLDDDEALFASEPDGSHRGGASELTSASSEGESDADDLFAGQLDPMSLLAEMGERQACDDEAVLQPFEILRQKPWVAATRRKAGRRPKVLGIANQHVYDEAARPTRKSKKSQPSTSQGVSSNDEDDEDDEAAGGDGGGNDDSSEGGESGSDDGGTLAVRRKTGDAAGVSGRGSKSPGRRGGSSGRGRGSGGRGRGNRGDGDVNDMDNIFDDPVAAKLGLAAPRARRGRGRGGRGGRGPAWRKKRNAMPEDVSRKLGLANMMYAKNRYAEAIDLLMGVLQACPNFPDPYHTLGLLHEASGDARKALDFYMIAAHLTPKDVLLWKRLAALSSDLGFWRQAIYCFTKAIHRDSNDMDARWDRAVLYAQVGDVERAMYQLEMLSRARPGDAEVPKMLVRLYHRTDQPHKAIEVLERHMEQYPESTDLTHVNMLAELLIQRGSFEETFQLLQRASQVQPDDQPLPLDLTVKAGMCLAHMGQLAAADAQLAALLAEGPDQFSDLYLDVGAGFMAMGLHSRAIPFLSCLVDIPDLDDPKLWARLLDCYRQVGDLAAAVRLYDGKRQALERGDPRWAEACLTLCELYVETHQQEAAQQLLAEMDGRSGDDDAAAALNPPLSALTVSSGGSTVAGQPPTGGGNQALAVLLRRGDLHLKLGQRDAFIGTMSSLVESSVTCMLSDMAVLHDPAMPHDLLRAIHRQNRMAAKGRKGGGASETESVFKGEGKRDRRCKRILEVDRAAAAFLSELSDHDGAAGGGRSDAESDGAVVRGSSKLGTFRGLLAEPEHYGVLATLAQTMRDAGQTEQAKSMLLSIMTAIRKARGWLRRGQQDRLRLALAAAWLRLGDAFTSSQILKTLCASWPYSVAAWEQYCRVLAATAGSGSWASFVGGLRSKHTASLPLMIMQGHVHAVNRHYMEALSEYHHASRFLPDDPLLLLCIATSHISAAMTRQTPDRHRAVLTGFAYLQEYAMHRGNEQESAYNTGRALHELGLVHLAVPWYERALAAAAPQPMAPTSSSTQPSSTPQETHCASTRQAPCPATSSVSTEQPVPAGVSRHDLRREAAHNLALIYVASGAKELARQVYLDHLVL